jgi:hypothetical protein
MFLGGRAENKALARLGVLELSSFDERTSGSRTSGQVVVYEKFATTAFCLEAGSANRTSHQFNMTLGGCQRALCLTTSRLLGKGFVICQ